MQPVLFLSHDDPSQVVNAEHPSYKFLNSLSAQLVAPKAIICISAHWETSTPSVSGAGRLETIHDFYGFPASFYQLNYDVNGNPPLAREVAKLLKNQNIDAKIDLRRGIDHGAWCVLKLLFPEANIPVIQLSINPQGTAEEHFAIGNAIKSLREQNVLIIASGTTTHNLSAWKPNMAMHGSAEDYVIHFRDWLIDNLNKKNFNSLFNYLEEAPFALKNHPSQDHILPLFTALGAANDDEPTHIIDDSYIYGHFSMASFIWGQEKIYIG